MSSLLAPLSMFFVVWLPTRDWDIPSRTMPDDWFQLICLLLFSGAFTGFSFILDPSQQIAFVSEVIDLMRNFSTSLIGYNGLDIKWVIFAGYIWSKYITGVNRSGLDSTSFKAKPTPRRMLDETKMQTIRKFIGGLYPEGCPECPEGGLKYFPAPQNSSVISSGANPEENTADSAHGIITSASPINHEQKETAASVTTPPKHTDKISRNVRFSEGFARISELVKTWNQRAHAWFVALPFYVIAFCAMRILIDVSIFSTNALSGLYSALFTAIPEIALSLSLPAIFCFLTPSLGGRERIFAMYVYLAVLCLSFGTCTMILFCLNVWFHLHLTYVRCQSTSVCSDKKATSSNALSPTNNNTSPTMIENESSTTTETKQSHHTRHLTFVMRIRSLLTQFCRACWTKLSFWLEIVSQGFTKLKLRSTAFFVKFKLRYDFVFNYFANVVSWIVLERAFVAGFCTKLISHHCSIDSLLLTMTLFLLCFDIYKFASIWAHGENHNEGDTYRFERGDANTQFVFVARNWRVFSVVFAAAALCTMGQMHTTPRYSIQPETISHLFCKTNNETQLECLVNAAYFNPSDSDSEKCFCDSNATEWDFCGGLRTFA